MAARLKVIINQGQSKTRARPLAAWLTNTPVYLDLQLSVQWDHLAFSVPLTDLACFLRYDLAVLLNLPSLSATIHSLR